MDAQDMQAPQDEPLSAPDDADEPETPAEPALDSVPVVPPLPRVVAETPLGGPPPRVEPTPAPAEPVAVDEAPPAEDESKTATQERAQVVPPETAELAADEAEAVPQTTEETPAPATAVEAEAGPASAEVEREPVAPAPAAEPELAADWDEEISAELAAVLFAAGAAAKERAADAPSVDAGAVRPEEGALPAPAAAPTPTAKVAEEAAAAPEVAPTIQLIDRAGARTLPLTAQSRSAPAADHLLEGKARYRRLEEPMPNDQGQLTIERWDYLPDHRPTLGARAVTMVRIEGRDYADGSWSWQFERRYADRGVDRRVARGNPDGTYVEREDEVSKLDPTTGQRQKFRERAHLILAAPAAQEKRGGFLSGLLGRDEEPEVPAERVWRDATPGESRQQRRGRAFRRGWFG